jgi:peptidoglycan biosynthesis protein MviN/MurJ (putative lipid II flippase)
MLRQNTYKKGLLWLLLLNVIAKGITFILGIILAKNFLPRETDIYLYIWSLISIVSIIVSQVNLMVAGPAYIALIERKEDKQAADLCSAFFNIYTVVLSVLALVIVAAPLFAYGAISGFTDSQLGPFTPMLRISGIWLVFTILNTVIGNIFLSRKYFVVYMLGQVIVSVIAILLILILKHEFGVDSFFIGQLVGNLVCFIFYLVLLRRKLNQRIRLFYFSMPGKTLKEIGAVLVVSIPTLIVNLLLVYYLSNFSTGQLSAYSYGSAIANLPDAIFLSQVISIFGVKFAEEAAKDQKGTLFNTFRFFGNHLFFFMGGIAIVLSLGGFLVIQFLYGRQNLGDEVFESAVLSLSLLASALPFKSLDVLNNRLFASLQALSSLVKYTLPVKLFNIGLLILMANSFGFKGVLWHQLFMPAVVVLVQIALLGKFFPASRIKKYYTQVLALLCICVLVYVAGYFLVKQFIEHINPYLLMFGICLMVLLAGYLVEKLFRLTTFNRLLLDKGTILWKKFFRTKAPV